MARIAGVNIPINRTTWAALQSIYGIGPERASEICTGVRLEPTRRASSLNEQEVQSIREYIDSHYKVEGDLRREVTTSIKRLTDLRCYRGIRHRKGLPVRGQRTSSNARTRRGKSKPIAAKKK